jgi:dsRNA-specific ribonuclease
MTNSRRIDSSNLLEWKKKLELPLYKNRKTETTNSKTLQEIKTMSRKQDQRRMDSPYGIPSNMILYDKTKEEIKSHGQGERFGAPYRSEKYQKQDRYPRSFENRREDKDRRWKDTRESPKRTHPHSDRRYPSRPQRSPQRERKPFVKNPEEKSPRSHESIEEFDIRSKEVIIPTEDIQKIRKEICDMMNGTFDIVEGVVDPSHDTSVYLSEDKKVGKLFTFIGKKNPELIEKLEKCRNIQIVEDSFVYTPAEVRNPFVLFLYPYWLMGMDEKNVKNVYFKNIPLQSGSFDDILRIEQAELFVFIIPRDVNVPDEYGKKKEIELSRGKLVMIQSKKQTSILNYQKNNKSLNDTITKDPKKEIYTSDEEWDKNFEIFLKNILIPIAKEEIINRIVNPSTLSMWKKAFTHETIDLNDNYEQLETIGDRVLELCFLKYLLRKFPDLSPQEITELKSKYMSKIYQGTTSRKLGFGDWIRVGNDISSISILEDVFESFFGALFEISDHIIGDGVGYVLSLKFLTLIFEDVKFDLSKAQGHPRSQIKEIFEMLKLDAEIQDITTNEKGTNVVLSITDQTLNDLIELEKMNKNASKVIGIGFGPYKTNAVNLAYSNALEYLEGLGITRQWAEHQKELYDLMVPELDSYIGDAMERMVKENYDRIYIRTSRASVKAGNVVIQLVGEYVCDKKKKIQKKILMSGKYPDIQTGKIDVVKRYACN